MPRTFRPNTRSSTITADGRGSELQDNYLPKELGGRAEKASPPKIGPKDDGALASRISITVPAGSKP